ncbi:MAG: hypothetical protein ACRC33_08285 [Gemmataceae bacterium]
MTLLYRSMQEDADGQPVVGPSASQLGVRPKDVGYRDDDALIGPGDGGLSVTPDDPRLLPDFRRPPEWGGDGKDPVWVIDSADIGTDLRYRPDPAAPGRHGFLEAAVPMRLIDYRRALGATHPLWRKVAGPGV